MISPSHSHSLPVLSIRSLASLLFRSASEIVWRSLAKPLHALKRLVIVGASLVIILSLYHHFTYSDSNGYSLARANKKAEQTTLKELYLSIERAEKYGDESERYTVLVVRNIACSAVGMLCTLDPNDYKLAFKESAVGKLTSVLTLPMKNPPASFYYLARDTLENAGFVPKTYAQGIGFNALSTFRPIWKAFRDLAYLLIVLVMTGVGFMIMFQIGGGEKAASLQTALPKLVIALIAISMSYAIAGLFIDLMYISIAFIVQLLGTQAGLDAPQRAIMAGEIIAGQPTDIFWKLVFGTNWNNFKYDLLANDVYALLPQYMQELIESVTGVFTMRLLFMFGMNQIAGIQQAEGQNAEAFKAAKDQLADALKKSSPYQRVGVAVKAGIAKILGPLKSTTLAIDDIKTSGSGTLAVSTIMGFVSLVVGLVATSFLSGVVLRYLLSFIFAMGMVFIFFRMIVMVFTLYVEILVSVFIAPIILMFEAIPGQDMFVKWSKGLLVNLAVYPLITGIFLISRIIINQGSVGVIWAPPFAVTMGDQSSLQLIIGAILIYAIPDLVKKFRSTFGGTSMLGELGIGAGSLFVGLAPVLAAGKTVMGASGLGGAITHKFTDPVVESLGFARNSLNQLVPKK